MDDVLIDEASSVYLREAPPDDARAAMRKVHQLALDTIDALDAGDDDDEESDVLDLAGSLVLMVPMVEALLGSDEDPSPEECGVLAHMLSFPVVPELVLICTAFGRRVAEEHLREMVRTNKRVIQRGATTAAEIDAIHSERSRVYERTAQMLWGKVRRQPDEERLVSLARILRRVASHLPHNMRCETFSMLGWIFWARGKRALAVAYSEEGRCADASNLIAQFVGELIDVVASPEWLDRKAR